MGAEPAREAVTKARAKDSFRAAARQSNCTRMGSLLMQQAGRSLQASPTSSLPWSASALASPGSLRMQAAKMGGPQKRNGLSTAQHSSSSIPVTKSHTTGYIEIRREQLARQPHAMPHIGPTPATLCPQAVASCPALLTSVPPTQQACCLQSAPSSLGAPAGEGAERGVVSPLSKTVGCWKVVRGKSSLSDCREPLWPRRRRMTQPLYPASPVEPHPALPCFTLPQPQLRPAPFHPASPCPISAQPAQSPAPPPFFTLPASRPCPAQPYLIHPSHLAPPCPSTPSCLTSTCTDPVHCTLVHPASPPRPAQLSPASPHHASPHPV